MIFHRYTSIENHYREKFLAGFLERFPELKDEEFVVTEKIHGSNVSILISKDEYRIAKRNNFTSDSPSDHFGVRQVIDESAQITQAIKSIQHYLIGTGNIIVLYGEIFGKGVQKEINYGPNKSLLFFDIAIQEEDGLNRYLPYGKFISFCRIFDVPMAPEICRVQGLDNALNFESRFRSTIFPEATGGIAGENICEGVVIKPIHKVYVSPVGEVFYIKKKNKEFMEEHSTKAIPKVSDLTEIGKFQSIFKGYITEARLNNVISKYGPIPNTKEISNYIKYMLDDAKADFLKDHDISEIPTADVRSIWNVGADAYKLICKVI